MDAKLKKFLRQKILETRLKITHGILAKNRADFCPCLKNMHEDQLRSSRLICLIEVLRQSNIDCYMVISNYSYLQHVMD